MSRSSNNYIKLSGIKGPVKSIGIPSFNDCFEVTACFFSLRSTNEVTSSGIMQGFGGIAATRAYFVFPVKYNDFMYFAHSKKFFKELSYVIKKDTDKKALSVMEIVFHNVLFETCLDNSVASNVNSWLDSIASTEWQESHGHSSSQGEYKNDFYETVSLIGNNKKNLMLGQGQSISISFDSFKQIIRPVRSDGSTSGQVVFEFKGCDAI